MDSSEIFCPLTSRGPCTCRHECGPGGADDAQRGAAEGVCTSGRDPLAGHSLAMVYSPEQAFCNLYEPEEGLLRGTVFAELEKPFCGDGRRQ